MNSRRRNWGIGCGGVLLVLLACAGLAFPLQVVWHLATGWVMFLVRTVPTIRVDASAIISAAIVLGVFFGGLQVAVSRGLKDRLPVSWSARTTRYIAMSVLLLFTAGISLVGIAHQGSWLVFSQEPILRNQFSRWVLASESGSNQKQIAINIEERAKTEGEFAAAGIVTDDGRWLHSWVTVLLPYFERQNLYERIDRTKPWRDESHAAVFRTPIPDLQFPGTQPPEVAGEFSRTNYALNSRLLQLRGSQAKDRITDSSGHTILLGEASVQPRAWGDPANWRDPALGIGDAADQFNANWGEQGAYFTLCDGATRMISKSIDPAVLLQLATPAGGEKVGEF